MVGRTHKAAKSDLLEDGVPRAVDIITIGGARFKSKCAIPVGSFPKGAWVMPLHPDFFVARSPCHGLSPSRHKVASTEPDSFQIQRNREPAGIGTLPVTGLHQVVLHSVPHRTTATSGDPPGAAPPPGSSLALAARLPHVPSPPDQADPGIRIASGAALGKDASLFPDARLRLIFTKRRQSIAAVIEGK